MKKEASNFYTLTRFCFLPFVFSLLPLLSPCHISFLVATADEGRCLCAYMYAFLFFLFVFPCVVCLLTKNVPPKTGHTSAAALVKIRKWVCLISFPGIALKMRSQLRACCVIERSVFGSVLLFFCNVFGAVKNAGDEHHIQGREEWNVLRKQKCHKHEGRLSHIVLFSSFYSDFFGLHSFTLPCLRRRPPRC